MSTNIIKKPFACFALVMVLLLGMVMPVFASEAEFLPEGIKLKGKATISLYFDGRVEEVEVFITKGEDNNLKVEFPYSFKESGKVSIDLDGYMVGEFSGHYYGYSEDYNDGLVIDIRYVSEGVYSFSGTYFGPGINNYYGDLDIEGTVEAIKDEPETKSLSTMFSGNTSSKWGEYDVALSGRIAGDFKEGVNELTADQIKAQTISAVVYNNLTDEIVVRNANQITGAKVTVKDGKIVNVEIDGKANTPNGRADTYNAKIDL